MSVDAPIALITGGAKRVGRAMGIEFARAGYEIVLTYRTGKSQADQTRNLCESHGVKAHVHHLDLTDLASIESISRFVIDQFNRLDVLVHNASRYDSTRWGDITPEDLEAHFKANASGPLLLTQALRRLLARAAGSVVVMGDMHVLGRPRKHYAAYNMSKAAITEMVRTLAREMAPDVRINAIAPGVVAWPEGTDSEEIAAYEKRIPLGRSGTPEEAAKLALFLARDNTYITGQIIPLDGGRSLT